MFERGRGENSVFLEFTENVFLHYSVGAIVQVSPFCVDFLIWLTCYIFRGLNLIGNPIFF